MLRDQQKRVAVVTGGAGGIGSVVVCRLAGEGMRVALVTTDTKKIHRFPASLRTHIRIFSSDVTNEESVRSLFDEVSAVYRRVDVVVNTVGGYLPTTPLEQMTAESWDRMMRVNLRSAFLVTREAIRRMKPRHRGHIINFSALGGLRPAAGRIPYAISKMGVSLMTQVLAEELRGSGIVVAAIAPGTVNTAANRTWGSPKDIRGWITTKEIAEAVVYLCSPLAAPASGATLVMAGKP